jgi:hypothetical protein
MGTSTFGGGNFALGIYQDAAGVPGALVGLLSGAADPRGNINSQVTYYDYTGAVGLAPASTYWVVAQSSSYYVWNRTADLSQSGTDTLGDSALNVGGGGWTVDPNSHLQLSISAVPEPAAAAEVGGLVILAGALGSRLLRRKV